MRAVPDFTRSAAAEEERVKDEGKRMKDEGKRMGQSIEPQAGFEGGGEGVGQSGVVPLLLTETGERASF